MNLDDLITLILFLIFIAAPFLKGKKKKKVEKPAKSKQRKFSVLGKIREALKEAAREMAVQVDQAGKKSENHTFWDEIDDRDDADFYSGDTDAPALEQSLPANEKPPFVSKPTRIPETRDSAPLTRAPSGHGAIQDGSFRPGPGQLSARARGLQNAVIWSEILGKPVAFRD